MKRPAVCACTIALLGALGAFGAFGACTTDGGRTTTQSRASSSGATTMSATTTVGDPGPGAGRLTVIARYEPICLGTPGTAPASSAAPATCPSEPIPGVSVTLTSVDGASVASATTDANGTAAFVIAPGSYVVVGGATGGPRITPRPTRVTVAATSATTVTLRYLSSFQ